MTGRGRGNSNIQPTKKKLDNKTPVKTETPTSTTVNETQRAPDAQRFSLRNQNNQDFTSDIQNYLVSKRINEYDLRRINKEATQLFIDETVRIEVKLPEYVRIDTKDAKKRIKVLEDSIINKLNKEVEEEAKKLNEELLKNPDTTNEKLRNFIKFYPNVKDRLGKKNEGEINVRGQRDQQPAPPRPSTTEKRNEPIVSPALNLSLLIEGKKPFFRKSYSAFDILTPYIKCYILTPSIKVNKKNIKSIEKTFFDIPYNMIKSLELEFAASPGVSGQFTLKLEDSTGLIGDILVSQLYSLGLLKNIEGVPKINVEFGWAINGLKKISKKYDVYYKNFFSEYMIQDVDIEFSEKFKQELTIKGIQDQVGILELMKINGNSEGSPYYIIGHKPVHNMRLLQYYHYFSKSSNLQNAIKIFPGLKTGEDLINFSKTTIVAANLKESFDPTNDRTNLLGILSGKQNTFFNHLNITNTNFNSIKAILQPYLNRSYFNSYLVFCYVLNQYIQTIKNFYKRKLKNNPVFYLFCLYDENKIQGLTPSTISRINFDEYCKNDVLSGTSKSKSNIVDSEFSIEEKESWESVLSRLARLVKINNNEKNKKADPFLYFEINRYIDSTFSLKDENKTFSDIGLNNLNKDILLKKFEKLKDFYKQKSDSNSVTYIEDSIKTIKASNEDFIYIIITAGAPFLTDENIGDKPILQSYTVFPKINSDTRLEYQNFNSGSNNFYDESYPDVIYFRPKINFKNTINPLLTTKNDPHYFNGIINYSNDNFNIVDINETNLDENQKKELIENKIVNIIKDLQINNNELKQIKVYYQKYKGINLYSIVGYDNLFFHSTDLDSYFSEDENKSVKTFKISGPGVPQELQSTFSNLRNHFEQYLSFAQKGYHASILNSLIKKSHNVFPGDNNLSNFYYYVNTANEYRKLLRSQLGVFEAELKILGEPAFSYDFGKLQHILIKVNNFDGSENILLSGIYSLSKIKHSIEGGKFETTLNLLYSSAWDA